MLISKQKEVNVLKLTAIELLKKTQEEYFEIEYSERFDMRSFDKQNIAILIFKLFDNKNYGNIQIKMKFKLDYPNIDDQLEIYSYRTCKNVFCTLHVNDKNIISVQETKKYENLDKETKNKVEKILSVMNKIIKKQAKEL